MSHSRLLKHVIDNDDDYFNERYSIYSLFICTKWYGTDYGYYVTQTHCNVTVLQ